MASKRGIVIDLVKACERNLDILCEQALKDIRP